MNLRYARVHGHIEVLKENLYELSTIYDLMHQRRETEIYGIKGGKLKKGKKIIGRF